MKAFPKTVIVEPDTVEGREKETATGFVIVEKPTNRDGARVFLAFGTVVSTGLGDIKVGDRVGYNPYDAFEFKLDGKTYEGIPEAGLRVLL